MHKTDHELSNMKLRDWRQALKTPPSYRIGSSSFRVNPRHMILIAAACLVVFIFLYYTLLNSDSNHSVVVDVSHYNFTYPLTKPIRTGSGITYRVGVISDLDTGSKENDKWVSYYKKGYLTWKPGLDSVSIKWDEDTTKLESNLAQGGRGMELSELTVFNGKLYTMDDRTGIVYEIHENRVIPWVVLPDGNGKSSKGFKSEWAAVKDEQLFIGGLGKEWTNSNNEIINFDPQWVKTVTADGSVSHHDWRKRYIQLQKNVGVVYPGYMIHESASWSSKQSSWYFLPRRCSKRPYREDSDELMGTNLLLIADEYFTKVTVRTIGDVQPSHGFSSFKFLPGSDDQIIVAIKSEELKGATASYIMAFTVQGKILMPETKFADLKYEGFEFV